MRTSTAADQVWVTAEANNIQPSNSPDLLTSPPATCIGTIGSLACTTGAP
jgi:hypothetical protein